MAFQKGEESYAQEFSEFLKEQREHPIKRHASPTKRLIAQKNSTWEHKTVFARNRISSPRKDAYQLQYTTQPGKSYVIAPEGGELNYDLARKNPEHFYDVVVSQNITEHKARDSSPRRADGSHKVEVTTRLTHRRIGKILMLVQSELVEVLRKNYSYGQLGAAFKDPRVMQSIQKHVQNKNI